MTWKPRMSVTAIALGVTLLTAAPALASGGQPATGGGANAGGVNKGGVKDVIAAPPPPCATLPSVTAPVGYYLSWAAVWNTFTVQSCSTATETVNVEVSETDVATGAVGYDVVLPITLTRGQNLGRVLDNDFAPFNTTYTVAVTARDTNGNVLSSKSLTARTPAPR